MGGGDSSQSDVRPRGLLVQQQNQIIQGSERGDVQHSASGGCAKNTQELRVTKLVKSLVG